MGPIVSVQYLQGVGPRRAAFLERLGITTLEELLYHFPRDWQDRRPTEDLSLPTANSLFIIRGRVVKARYLRAGASLGLFKAEVATGSFKARVVWFKHE